MHFPSCWVDCLARCGRIIGLLGIAAGLAACSAVKLAYNNIDEVAYWWLDSYVDFTDDQSRRVRTEIQRLHGWHRQQELPRVAALLDGMEQLAAGDLSAAQACAFEPQLRERLAIIAEQAEPAMAGIAAGLEPDQVAHLRRRLEKTRRDFADDWVQPDIAAMKDKRFDRMVERAEQVYGTLAEQQRAVLRGQIGKSSFDPKRVAAEQQRRHQDLLAVIAQIAGQPVPAQEARALLRGYLQRLLHSPDPQWRAYEGAFIQETCGVISALHNSTTAAQREVAARRLRAWQRDVRELAAQR